MGFPSERIRQSADGRMHLQAPRTNMFTSRCTCRTWRPGPASNPDPNPQLPRVNLPHNEQSGNKAGHAGCLLEDNMVTVNSRRKTPSPKASTGGASCLMVFEATMRRRLDPHDASFSTRTTARPRLSDRVQTLSSRRLRGTQAATWRSRLAASQPFCPPPALVPIRTSAGAAF